MLKQASRDLQINFNQAEDPLTISTKSRGDNKCGSATQSSRSLLPESGADAPAVLSAVYTDSTQAKNRQADVPQYGRSMIEMLGVLAIIGVLSVGGIAGYSKAMQKYRINKTIEQITLIAGNVRSFFAPQKNYDGVNCRNCGNFISDNPGCNQHGCPIIKKAKILPDEMLELNEDGTIKQITNPFGGGVELWVDYKATDGDKQAFSIELKKIPEESCIELLSLDWTGLGNTVINVRGTTGCGHWSCGGTEINKYFIPPIDVDQAVEVCKSLPIYFYIDVDPNSEYWQNLLNPS